MKNFDFIYLDKDGNELQKEVYSCQNKRQAMKIASAFLANSMLNDLKTIKTRKTVKP
jgi:hypothetical protein